MRPILLFYNERPRFSDVIMFVSSHEEMDTETILRQQKIKARVIEACDFIR